MKNDREILEYANEKWKESTGSAQETDYRTIAEDDYRFYEGVQDSTEVMTYLETQRRPTIVINKIKSKIDMLIGLGGQMRQEFSVIPMGPEDVYLAELMDKLVKFEATRLNLEEQEVEAFGHTIKGGRSFFYLYVNDENPFDPKIDLRILRGDQVWLDPDTSLADLSDCGYYFLEGYFSEEEVRVRWPSAVDSQGNLKIAKGRSPYSMNATVFEETERYHIIEFWYKEVRRVNWVIDPISQKPKAIDKKDWQDYLVALLNGVQVGTDEQGEPIIFKLDKPLDYVEKPKTIYKYAIYSQDTLLDAGDSPWGDEIGFPLVMVPGYRAEVAKVWFGAITVMKDPQKSFNSMIRRIHHMLNTAHKPMPITTSGNIVNLEEYKQRSSSPDFILFVQSIEKFKLSQQPNIPPIYTQIVSESDQWMKDSSGIQDSLLGIQTTSREPGIALKMRQEQGLAVLYTLYMNYAMARKRLINKLINFIRLTMTEHKVVRIAGPEGQQFIEINSQMNPQSEGYNNIAEGHYDIDVVENVSTTNHRLAVAQLLAEFNHQSPGLIPPDVIVDYAGLPASVVQRTKEAWEAMNKQKEKEEQKE